MGRSLKSKRWSIAWQSLAYILRFTGIASLPFIDLSKEWHFGLAMTEKSISRLK